MATHKLLTLSHKCRCTCHCRRLAMNDRNVCQLCWRGEHTTPYRVAYDWNRRRP